MSDSLDRKELLLQQGFVELGRVGPDEYLLVKPATHDVAHRRMIGGTETWTFTHFTLDYIFDLLVTALHRELHSSSIPPPEFRGKNCHQVAVEKMTAIFPQWQRKDT